MTGPTFHAGDEIEWLDNGLATENHNNTRWRPGRIADVRYGLTTDVPGELLSLPACMIRSAPRLPLEGIEQ